MCETLGSSLPLFLGRIVPLLALHSTDSLLWLPSSTDILEPLKMLRQVMALIAYLMQHKNNYGPHLIIVPNAVMVNWKSELTAWLPSAKCVYYVGHKDERARKFNLEVASLQFNVLVTTYEYIMRDRTKLSKVGGPLCCLDLVLQGQSVC